MKPVKTIDKTLMSVFAFFLLVSLLALFMFFIRMIPIEGYGKVYYEGDTKIIVIGFHNSNGSFFEKSTQMFSAFGTLYDYQKWLPIATMTLSGLEIIFGIGIIVFAKKTDKYDDKIRLLKYIFIGVGVVIVIFFCTTFILAVANHGGPAVEVVNDRIYFRVKHIGNEYIYA